MTDPVDTGLTAEVVLGIRRNRQCWSNIAARMALDQEQRFLGKLGSVAHAVIVVSSEYLGREVSFEPCPTLIGRLAVVNGRRDRDRFV